MRVHPGLLGLLLAVAVRLKRVSRALSLASAAAVVVYGGLLLRADLLSGLPPPGPDRDLMSGLLSLGAVGLAVAVAIGYGLLRFNGWTSRALRDGRHHRQAARAVAGQLRPGEMMLALNINQSIC